MHIHMHMHVHLRTHYEGRLEKTGLPRLTTFARVSSRQPTSRAHLTLKLPISIVTLAPTSTTAFQHNTSNAHSVQAVNMGKAGKRSHDEVDTYEEDDFVENDDGAARKTKKTKKTELNSDDQEKFWEVCTEFLFLLLHCTDEFLAFQRK